MIIDKNKNFIFVHNPRTSGTSFRSVLKDTNDSIFFKKYFPISMVKHPDSAKDSSIPWPVFSHENHCSLVHCSSYKELEKYKYKFTIVRNTWSRCVSYFLKTQSFMDNILWPSDQNIILKFEKYVDVIYNRKVKGENFRYLFQYPQTHWTSNVDEVIDFYDLDKKWKTILKKCNVKNSFIRPHVNGSSNKQYCVFYRNKEMIEKIHETYFNEIEKFNFKFEEGRQ